MDILNDLIPFIGLLVCTYAFLSKRICTHSRINVFNFVLLVAAFLLLLLADAKGFKPHVFTVVSRCILLQIAINLTIKNRLVNSP